MAKGGKFTKLMKKLSFGKTSKTNISVTSHNMSSSCETASLTTLQPVYVGKSRRQYLVTTDMVSNPLFQQLIAGGGGDGEEIRVGCEVVLFEHLLWMLQNADPQPESLDELAEFYAC
ncbi:hypothetical protein RND81_08G034000 [Saponaria officinalis]|uniref:Uncharacterized protein n=1 Tax=Saponaria officinalis TaxID=3572 RepID=A0AAW1J4X1_SAPOF